VDSSKQLPITTLILSIQHDCTYNKSMLYAYKDLKYINNMH